jgi:hypothetical protein
VAGVITASQPSWTGPFTGLSPRCFGKLVTALRREGADTVRRGRPWSLPLEDRVLLVAAYWRTNLTMRRLAALSESRSLRPTASSTESHRGSHCGRADGSARTPCSSWKAPWYPHVTMRWQSSRKTIGTPPTTRSSSTPIHGWSSQLADLDLATATTARHRMGVVRSQGRRRQHHGDR